MSDAHWCVIMAVPSVGSITETKTKTNGYSKELQTWSSLTLTLQQCCTLTPHPSETAQNIIFKLIQGTQTCESTWTNTGTTFVTFYKNPHK